MIHRNSQWDEVQVGEIIKYALSTQVVNMNKVGLKEEKAKQFLTSIIGNISRWIREMRDIQINSSGFSYLHTIGVDQEYASNMFGIKNKIDATLLIWDETRGEELVTGLELKTGTRESAQHWGLVLLLGLLLKERFEENANDKNFLVYITKGGQTHYYEKI